MRLKSAAGPLLEAKNLGDVQKKLPLREKVLKKHWRVPNMKSLPLHKRSEADTLELCVPAP